MQGPESFNFIHVKVKLLLIRLSILGYVYFGYFRESLRENCVDQKDSGAES